MTRRARTTLTAAVIALSAASATPSDAAVRTCSNVTDAEVISASGVTCRTAHRVARAWVREVRDGGSPTRTVLGYRCRTRADEIEGSVTVCRRNGKRVAWYPNVRRGG